MKIILQNFLITFVMFIISSILSAEEIATDSYFDGSATETSGISGGTTTLKQVIGVTLDTNPDILSQSRERAAVEEELAQARAGYFPTVDINAGIGRERSDNPTTRNNGDGSVSLTRKESGIIGRQLLFDGFATSNEIKRQRARVNSQAYSVSRISELTALRAADAYLNVLNQRELVALGRSNLEAHKQIQDQIKSRKERGVGRASDLDQISGRVALAESNLRAEQGNLRDAETAFLRVVGEMPADLSQPDNESVLLPDNVEDAVAQALADNPTLRSSMADVDAAKAQHEAANSVFFPRLDLEVGGTLDDDVDGIRGRNKDAFAMVRMQYNIFSGGRDTARRRETSQLHSQALEIRHSVHRQVEESVRLSWNAYETVKGQVSNFRQHVLSSEKARFAYGQQFSIGQRTLLDVLDQENEVFVSRTSFVNSKYDLLFSKYRILTGINKLLANFGIELPG